MAGTEEVETEQRSSGSGKIKGQNSKQFNFLVTHFIKHIPTQGVFFVIFLSDSVTVQEKRTQNTSDRRAAINAQYFISVHVIKLNCTASSDKVLWV